MRKFALKVLSLKLKKMPTFAKAYSKMASKLNMPVICHAHVPLAVIVRKGFDSLEEMNDVEADLLDRAWGLEPDSRFLVRLKLLMKIWKLKF
jgi:hypothetical protein